MRESIRLLRPILFISRIAPSKIGSEQVSRGDCECSMLGEYIPIGSRDHDCQTCEEPLGDDLIFVAYAPFGVSFLCSE